MTFQLQLLHASDLEGGVDAISAAPNFAAIVEALESTASSQSISSVLISAGDNYLPGPFFGAAGDRDLRDVLQAFYQEFFNEPNLDNIREGNGRIDISIMNAIGFDASAVGNHEFDAGATTFADLIGTDIRGTEPGDVRWLGAQFPYLSANLDFSQEEDLAGLFTSDILPSTDFQSVPTDLTAAGDAPKIAPATVIERDGESIGVIGATTQILTSITSTGNVEVTGPDENNMALLAGVLQPIIDDVIDGDDNTVGTADDVNHIILTTHLQQFALEQELAPLLSGVDIIISGGSDTLLADSSDRLRSGDTADGDYPFIATGDDGNPTAIVSTDGEYSYVGQLIVTFDDDGVIDTSSINPIVSGVFATDDQGVTDVWNTVAAGQDPFADGTKGATVKSLVDAVEGVVIASDGLVFGQSDVYLEGRRSFVRTEETNLGNLTADANLFAAQQFDPTVQVSLKNGGGIRSEIGSIDGLTGDLLPNEANSLSGKEAGEISQLDLENVLRFNNELTLLTVTAEELKNIIEHAVAGTEPGSTPGQFPQVGGLTFSFDATRPAIAFDEDGTITTEGKRVRSLGITGDDGKVTDLLVRRGKVQGDPTREIRLVTLNFLADGGDGYPYPTFGEDRVDLTTVLTDAGAATAADPGTEQDALAEFLLANFDGDDSVFDSAETPIEEDRRIQNLAVRSDAILQGGLQFSGAKGRDSFRGFDGNDDFSGGGGRDTLRGRDGDDALAGEGGQDLLVGGKGDDILDGGNGKDSLRGNGGSDVLIGGPGSDKSIGGGGADIFVLDSGKGFDIIRDFGKGKDQFGLGGDLKFGDLEFTQLGSKTLISSESGDLLAEVRKTALEDLTRDLFTRKFDTIG